MKPSTNNSTNKYYFLGIDWKHVWKKTKTLTKFVWKSIIPDLMAFTKLEFIALTIFAATSVVFSFISFNHLYDPVTYPSIYNVVNDRLAGIEPWRREMMCISGAASFTGVLCVVLTTKGKITCFLWGAINSLLYGLFAYAYGYAGDAQLNLFFFFPVQFLGIYLWGEDMIPKPPPSTPSPVESSAGSGSDEPLTPTDKREGETEDDEEDPADHIPTGASLTIKSHTLSLYYWILSFVATGAISVAFYYEIPVFARAISGIYYFDGILAPHVLDAIVNALSMVAQVLSLYQYSEQWYWWLAVDVLQITMFAGIAGYGIVINVVVMWCLFTINAIAGLYAWQVRGETDSESQRDNESQRDRESKREDERDGLFEEDRDMNDIEVGLTESQKQQAVGVYDLSCTTCTDPFGYDNFSQDNAFQPPLEATPTNVTSNKPFARGLVVGKFWPFHAGHAYLLSQASAQCDALYVIVCDCPLEHRPSGSTRVTWIRETVRNACVTSIVDVYDATDSALWAKLAIAWCGTAWTGGRPDAVFTSEHYGTTWAKHLGCQHICIDLPRTNVPISGTLVRSRPLRESWSLLPPAVRAYYCKRIVIVGSESTGKTTLTQTLAKRFPGSASVMEYARVLCDRKLIKGREGEGEPEYEDYTDDDFDEILCMQAQHEREACSSADTTAGVIFCDTDNLATSIWYERYHNGKSWPKRLQERYEILREERHRFGREQAYVRERAQKWGISVPRIQSEAYHHVSNVFYILLSIDGSIFVQDGYRDGGVGTVREDMEKVFIEKLTQQSNDTKSGMNAPFVVVKGSFEERTEEVIKLIESKWNEWQQEMY